MVEHQVVLAVDDRSPIDPAHTSLEVVPVAHIVARVLLDVHVEVQGRQWHPELIYEDPCSGRIVAVFSQPPLPPSDQRVGIFAAARREKTQIVDASAEHPLFVVDGVFRIIVRTAMGRYDDGARAKPIGKCRQVRVDQDVGIQVDDGINRRIALIEILEVERFDRGIELNNVITRDHLRKPVDLELLDGNELVWFPEWRFDKRRETIHKPDDKPVVRAVLSERITQSLGVGQVISWAECKDSDHVTRGNLSPRVSLQEGS